MVYQGPYQGPQQGLVQGIGTGYGPALLADFDFRTPRAQSFPATAVGLASAMGDAVCSPSHILGCQETSGNLVDAVAAKEFAPSGSPLQGQYAQGLWSGSYGADRCVEAATSGGSEFACTDVSVMDSNGASVAILVVFRSTGAAGHELAVKRAGLDGYIVRVTSTGSLQFYLDGASSAGYVGNLTGYNYADGAWHYACLVINETADVAYTYSDLESSSGSISTFGAITNSAPLKILDSTGSAGGCQVRYVAGFEGAAAEAITAGKLAAAWTHATDPTGLLTTATRSGLISVPTSASTVGHFGTDQLPIGYSALLAAGAGGLGLYCNSALTNLIDRSEDFTTSWASTVGTQTANAAAAPDGFQTATRCTTDATNQQMYNQYAVTQDTYTTGIWMKAVSSDVTVDVRLYDVANATYVGDTQHTVSTEWVRVDTVGTMGVTPTNARTYFRFPDSGADVYIWGADAILGTHTVDRPYIRTTGSTASLAVPDYESVFSAGSLLRAASGEVESVYVRYRDTNSGVNAYVYDSDNNVSSQQRRTVLLQSGRTPEAYLYDDAASLVGSKIVTSPAPDPDAAEQTHALRYSSTGLASGEYVEASHNGGSWLNGSASSFSASGAGDIVVIQLGNFDSPSSALALEGVIARLRTWGGPR